MSVTAQHSSVDASGAQSANVGSRADFGDVRAEFRALICGSGVYDLASRAKISLTGGDRVRWLNGMVTNNVRNLEPGRGLYAFLLNPQGHILGDLYAYNRGESLLIDTDQAQIDKILAVFDKYIIMDDVEVAKVSDQLTAIGIAGPNARASLQAAGFELPPLEPLRFADLTWQQIGLTLVCGDMVCGESESVNSFELWLTPGHAQRVHRALVDAGARPVGAMALDLLRVAAGVPRYGVDIRERDLPQETEQQRALNFSKGCYIGQEIVERIRSRGQVRRKFTGFEVYGPLPGAGSKVQLDGKDVGEITSAAALPLAGGDRGVALGYIRREVATAGKRAEAGASQVSVTSLPFAEVFK
jgi:folate-binding protein YgfZ